MPTSLAVRMMPETLRSAAFGAIGAGYTMVGTAFEHPIRILHIQNLTDALLLFSLDGANNHIAVPANGFILLDVTTNKSISNQIYFAKGLSVWVKQSGVATLGAVYVSAFYGVEI